METVKLDIQTLTLLGAIIPLIVGLITKKSASPGVKAVANLLVSAILGGIAVAVQSEGDVVLSDWLFNIAITFVLSIVSYYGLWKPTSVALAVQDKTEGFGIGAAGGIKPAQARAGRLTPEEMQELREELGLGTAETPVTAEQVRKATERDAAIDDMGNKLLNGASTVSSESIHPEGEVVKQITPDDPAKDPSTD